VGVVATGSHCRSVPVSLVAHFRSTCFRSNRDVSESAYVRAREAVREDGERKAGYDPGNVNRRRHTNLMDGTARRLLERIEGVGFWTQPLHPPDIVGLDGAQWIIEGIKSGEYHIIDRFTPKPSDGDAAYILGTTMAFDLARLHIKKSEIY
jgi:hypothetical protein